MENVKNWKWRIYKAGITQKKFCEGLGMLPSQLSDWINGAKIPRQTSIERVEKALQDLGV